MGYPGNITTKLHYRSIEGNPGNITKNLRCRRYWVTLVILLRNRGIEGNTTIY